MKWAEMRFARIEKLASAKCRMCQRFPSMLTNWVRLQKSNDTSALLTGRFTYHESFYWFPSRLKVASQRHLYTHSLEICSSLQFLAVPCRPAGEQGAEVQWAPTGWVAVASVFENCTPDTFGCIERSHSECGMYHQQVAPPQKASLQGPSLVVLLPHANGVQVQAWSQAFWEVLKMFHLESHLKLKEPMQCQSIIRVSKDSGSSFCWCTCLDLRKEHANMLPARCRPCYLRALHQGCVLSTTAPSTTSSQNLT